MTEFAYSGLGLNPHYGDPLSPFERAIGRASGGSTSGGAVSVVDGMAAAALGTDTGGSCRIPAAFCGLTGYKPTAASVPLQGAYPLSQSFDSIGSIAASASCCAILHGVLSGGAAADVDARAVRGVKLAVLRNYVLEDLEPAVADAFEAALSALSAAGAQIDDVTLPDLDRLPELNARGGIIAAEAHAHHRPLIDRAGARYDPRVISRIRRAEEQEDGEYQRLLAERREMIARADRATAPYAAILAPTTPILPPRLDVLADDAAYGRINLLALRNPTVANHLDRCAISLPATPKGAPPVGLMLIGPTGGDGALLSLARGVEQALGVS
jgi:aspartyl-tRNA(Asn)/glutamyl-tRNA(Gln) amidotransferase subunit A